MKNLIYSSSCSIYGICGEGLVKNVIWERKGLTENIRIPSYGGRKLKLPKKNHHMIFERSLISIMGNCESSNDDYIF